LPTLAQVNSHVGLLEATPPGHEAPAVVVEATTSMAGHMARVGLAVGLADIVGADVGVKKTCIPVGLGG